MTGANDANEMNESIRDGEALMTPANPPNWRDLKHDLGDRPVEGFPALALHYWTPQ
jgi:hypothetical protein